MVLGFPRLESVPDACQCDRDAVSVTERKKVSQYVPERYLQHTLHA